MSKLREELERQFKAYGLFTGDSKKETPKTEDNVAAIQPSTEQKSEVDVFTAPQNYQEEFANDFKNLPHNWQKFLSEREKNLQQKLDDNAKHLQTFQGIENMFNTRKASLNNQGIRSLQEWIEGLAWIDENMETRPAEVIRCLAVLYGVNLNTSQNKNEPVSEEMLARVHKLEHNFHKVISDLQYMRAKQLGDLMHIFANQKDEKGALLHPHFYEVLPQLQKILQGNGLSDIADAYNGALWLNPRIREELIDEKISSKAQEAEKARRASFAPKGKAQAPERRLTLREQLEKNMAAFRD